MNDWQSVLAFVIVYICLPVTAIFSLGYLVGQC